ncbi:hypothetical protein [Actinosynnema sp. NPDC020468]|uniref:hypothetical protein n=1 Tax=Actinosynnema sp. NPDC020468 TaxID=3154488 RepID=UPI0033E016BF
MRKILIPLVAAAAVTGLTTTPANAATAQVRCESGRSRYVCDTAYSGPIPTSVRWEYNGEPLSAADDRFDTGKRRRCDADEEFTVSVTITSTTDEPVTSTDTFYCEPGAWP